MYELFLCIERPEPPEEEDAQVELWRDEYNLAHPALAYHQDSPRRLSFIDSYDILNDLDGQGDHNMGEDAPPHQISAPVEQPAQVVLIDAPVLETIDQKLSNDNKLDQAMPNDEVNGSLKK